MIPVRKPGRPLSTCPCPPGRPCSCGGVRVAIPKKQKCGCPTEAENVAAEDGKEPSPAESPTSPSRPSYRVGKPNGSSRANSRKQSFDPANLERMDPRSINLIATPSRNGITDGLPVMGSPSLQGPPPNPAGFGPDLGVMSAGPGSAYSSPQNSNFASPIPYNMGFQYPQPNPLRHGVKVEDGGLYAAANGGFSTAMPPPHFVNGNHAAQSTSIPAQPAISVPKANGVASAGGSCCGGKAQDPAPAPAPAQKHVQLPQLPQQGYGQPYIPQLSGASSCCSSKAQKPTPSQNDMPSPHELYGQSYMSQFQFPTVFRYPGDYGSWQHPIDPIIWQQVASQTGMSLTTPMSPATNGDAVDAGPSHECSCGEGCQCVGCLAHPFNDQMFQYVNNAYNGSNGSSPRDADAPGGGGHAQTRATGRESPAEAPTPTGSEGSPPREEQSLSTMDYFFVNLPISGLCGGSLESCPCGESCDCPGCLVHNIPLNQG
jgi:hypothetical protein